MVAIAGRQLKQRPVICVQNRVESRVNEAATSGESTRTAASGQDAERAAVGARKRARNLLRWFGIDPTGLDPTRPCAVCGLPAAIGTDRCPTHRETELQNAVVLPRMRLGGVLMVGATLALLGVVLGVVAGDDRFAWIGAAAAASQVVAGLARHLRQPRFATAMGMVAFFTALTLIFAGILVAAITALPLLIDRLV